MFQHSLRLCWDSVTHQSVSGYYYAHRYGIVNTYVTQRRITMRPKLQRHTKAINIRVSPKLEHNIVKAAAKRDLSVSEYVREVLIKEIYSPKR